MSTLTGNKISLTYKSLIKTSDNDVLTGALKELSDGLGNNSGVFLNTGGDLKSTGTLEFSNFKATAYAVTINKLVNEADGISNNDNDTSLPTSAAVKDYVDTHVTSQDLDFSDGTNPGAVDLDSQVFAIVGTSNEIETSASGQQLQIGLPNDVTISGTYTGTTFSGDLNGTINTATTAVTQTAGDNSTKVATTAYVDTLDAASDLDFSDGSVNSAVNLNTQVFSIQGTSNEITTTASGQSLTIALDSTGVDLPDGSTAITQTAGDNSTKVATTAYVDVLDAASDLDIAGDTGTGDVNLNTQTLTLQGTTNQVITAVSGQTTTFSLPSTVHRDLQGNVTGNADTATAWQTARDLSISGEATGTLSSVDGTSNISGAVTLTNSAVTGKVLTGLPTPAASTVQASDSILEGIGKLQSQINGIANGLQFQGTWDAATNTPTLNSGGGEVDSGTTTGQTADKLIDSSQNFLTTVSVGDKVINQVDGQSALVTNVDSNTSLTLDADIMLSGEAYTIDASPFLVQGHYYVVSVGGTTSLNGNANWAIGDWVIAGADNIWSKLDHTQIDGQGTPGNLPVWNTATTLTDSIVSESGTALTVTGSLNTTLGASVTGDFAVNTDKFTVNATSGNTAFTGDLAINTNKFTVNATNGNISVAGTGAFAGNVEINDTISGNFTTNYDTKLLVGGEIVARSLTANESMISIGGDSTSAFIKSGKQDGSLTGRDLRFVRGSDEKLRVISTGIDITGAINADSATITGDVTITGDLSTTNSLGSIITVSRDAVPTSGNSLGRFEFSGEDIDTGNQYVTALISASAEANWATSSRTTQLNFNTTTGGVLSRALTLKGNNDAEFEANATFAENITIGDNKSIISNGSVRIDIDNDNDSTTRAFVVRNDGGTNTLFRVQEDGNVGIGTGSDTLTRNLTVKGTTTSNINIKSDASNGTSILSLGDGDDDNYAQIILDNSTNILQIQNGGGSGISSRGITLDSSENVGIGNINPSDYSADANNLVVGSLSGNNGITILSTSASGYGSLYFADSSTGNKVYSGFIRYQQNQSNMTFGTNEVERMRIDNSGIVTITRSFTPAASLSDITQLKIENTDTSFGGSAAGIQLDAGNGDTTGFILSRADGNDNTFEGVIIGTATDNPIIFGTNTGTSSILTNERMRITEGGELRVGHNSGTYTHPNTFAQFGNTVVANEYGASISSSGNSLSGYFGSNAHWANAAFSKPNSSRSAGYLQIVNTATSNAGSEFIFRTVLSGDTTHYTRMIIESDGSLKVPSVHSQTTGVGANVVVLSDGELLRSTSSLKYKTDVRDYDKGLNEVMQLQPKYYKGKNDESETQFAGLIAENVHDLGLTEFVQYADDGSPDALSYSHMIALLTKSIQELKAEVDSLKKECKCK